ncbi:serine/threonine-protein kinase pdik1l-like [Dendronephthya gigantea]|uniref:serine/threonine-protein kinase pdik1l-like n=1 Tax=Dendronephthya gigantea TaxID=151771 RepID=UPI00106AAAC9|nr:serine/threonine-protein kinase pdik1l-like [Dendronephthya gigantea]
MSCSHHISRIEYTRTVELGKGAFGTVHKAHEKERGTLYAVKDIKCVNNEDLNNAITEIKALGKLTHVNIIKLYNVQVSQSAPFEATLSLLLEYCSKGNLNEQLKNESTSTENFQWMRQILAAVAFLHKNNIVHRDLKPQNVLLTSGGVVKLADFGLVEYFGRKNDDQSWYDYYLNLGVGQGCYVAPEVLEEHYTYKADIFALGVIFYAILERTFIVVDDERLYGIFVGSNRQPLGILMFNSKRDVNLPFTKTTSPAITELLNRTLKYEYKARPDANEIGVILRQCLSRPWPCIIL